MTPRFHRGLRPLAAAFLCLGALIALPGSASADLFEFVYQGSFSAADALNPSGAPTGFFPGSTPFTATALFDDSGPNLAAPVGVAGFVAYSPIWATLTVGGQTYNMTTYNQDATRGVSVAIFDGTTPFGPPGHYAAGFLQNPLADGAGFIGDWVTSTPPFSATHLVSTVFTDYVGVGYGSGPVVGGGPTVVPIPLSDAMGNPYLLTLGNYDENLANGGAPNFAQLQSVPEPGSLALLAVGAMGRMLVPRRRRSA